MAKFKCLSINVNGLQDNKKRRAIFNWLQRKSYDIILLQETHCDCNKYNIWSREWSGRSYWTKCSSNERGVAILFNGKKVFDIRNVNEDNDHGRIISCDVYENDKIFNVVNVYAPNEGKERKKFVEKILKSELDVHNDGYKLVAGDYNCTLSNIDRIVENNIMYPEYGRTELLKVINDYDLEDIYRRRNPDKQMYTFRRANKISASRLDYWLISSRASCYIVKCDIDIVPCTDHRGVSIEINSDEIERGPGRWQMNDNVIKSERYRNMFEELWPMWLENKTTYKNVREWWVDVKVKIKELTIIVSKEKRKEMLKAMKMWDEIIKDEENGKNPNYDRLHNAKLKLDEIAKEMGEGARIRAKVQWLEDGERGTKFFHSLEKRKGQNKLWTGIKNEHSETVEGIGNILHVQKKFYQNLFSTEGIDADAANSLLDNIDVRLSDKVRSECDVTVTKNELSEEVKTLKCGTSPGMDGISNLFYKMYWYVIAEEFTEMAREVFEVGDCCNNQNLGVIVLLYKDGDREDIKNWRPITLLNADYKLLEKVMARRMKKVLPNIVENDQLGYLKDRYIGEGARLNEDILRYCDDNERKGAVLYIDQSKAFDRVEWKWLQMVLETYGFGKEFQRNIMTLYKNAKSIIQTNGYFSEPISLTRSVRQGLPLSPYLYILQTEPLAENLRKDCLVKGIEITEKGVEVKVCSYADDMQCYVRDHIAINHCFKMLELYGKASGAKINRDKTIGISLMDEGANSYSWIKWTEEPVKALGVPQAKGHNDFKGFWKGKVKGMDRSLSMWKQRDLTCFGRVHLLKSVGLSKVLYALNLKIMPDDIRKDVKKSMWKFLWRDKNERVSRKTCTRSLELGGLGMQDLDTVIKASRIMVVKRVLKGKGKKWSVLPQMYFECLDEKCNEEMFALKCTDSTELISECGIPLFYKECILYWQELKRCEKVHEPKDIMN